MSDTHDSEPQSNIDDREVPVNDREVPVIESPEEVDTSVDGCRGGEDGHSHTIEGIRLMMQGAVHVTGNTYRFGPPLPGHHDYDPERDDRP